MTALAEAERLRDGRLPDGTVGYLVRAPRKDDCFAAALATVLQVPIDEVPDPRLHERSRTGEDADQITRSFWQELDRWLTRRGLRMVTHRKVPVRKPRWLGVVPLPGAFNSHTLVMSYSEVLFDPTMDFKFLALAHVLSGPDLARVQRISPRMWGAEHVGYGFSFTTSKKEVI